MIRFINKKYLQRKIKEDMDMFKTNKPIKNKIILGYAKNHPRFVVEDKNHVSYRRVDDNE